MTPGASSSFTPAQRRALAAAAQHGGAIACPVCDVPMAHHAVGAQPELPYVRHRLLLICPRCRRSVSVDLNPGRPPA